MFITITIAFILIIAGTIFVAMMKNVQLTAFTQVATTTTIAPIEHAITTTNSSLETTTDPAIGVFDADSTPFGLTYGDWTARWWQWAYSILRDIHPAYDDTGKYCTIEQNGPVWFFPGTYGKPVVRECTIPHGRAILFPILNSECSFAEFLELKTLQQLRNCAKTFQDQVIQLQASIDGVDIPKSELEKYRIQSPPFNFTLPKDNILGLPANTSTQGIADGNWVFLKPLSPGIHGIKFKGDTVDANITTTITTPNNNLTSAATNNSSSSFAFPTGWNFETIYRITVTPTK
jgi:hypothetical protein